MTNPKLATTSAFGGRSYEHPVSGLSYPSVTTVLNTIGKGDALKHWAANIVAEYAVKNKATWIALDDAAAIDLLKREPMRSLDRASNRGTNVHAIAEAYATTGSMPEWADSIDGYVKALKLFFEDHRPEPVLIESTVFNEEVGYAGSFDLVCKLDAFPDALVMLDYKTSKAIYPDTAAQLAAYAFAPEYADINSKIHPMPKCDRAVIVRFASDGTYEVKEADLQAGWTYFKAVRVLHDLPTKDLLIKGKVRAVEVEPEKRDALATWLRARVLNIKENFPDALQQLIKSWSPMLPTFKSEHVHTMTELATIERMLNEIEGEHSIPFVAGNPRVIAAKEAKTAKKPATPAVAPKRPPVNKFPPVKATPASTKPTAKTPAKAGVTKAPAKPVVAEKGNDVKGDMAVSASEVDKLRTRLSKSSKKVQDTAARLAKQANAAKVPISLSGKPSLRRVLLVSAMLDALIQGEGSPDLLDAVMWHINVRNDKSLDSLGADLGVLTLDQIQQMSSVLVEIKKGTMAVTYNKTTNLFKVQKVSKK